METSPIYDPGGPTLVAPLPDDRDQFLARLANWQRELGLSDRATIADLRRATQQLRLEVPARHDR